ncbi:MAG: methyltransferase, partial [Myxococcales bacterium]|nr:methyltransferase [Myxococcales bacterium]
LDRGWRQAEGLKAVTAEARDLFRRPLLPDELNRFDAIVLDPPPFARSRKALEAARRAYKEINLRGFKLLRPGGRLFTFSCSAQMTRADFEALIGEAAADAGRFVRVIERRGPPADHPSLLTAPETDYLKALFLEVDR